MQGQESGFTAGYYFMRFLCTVLLTVLLLCGASYTVRADYFVWQDVGGLSFSFPDTWKAVTNADSDDLLTVMAPSGRGHAMCRVRVREDHRYSVYPPYYDSVIQKVDFSMGFWDRYLREYNDTEIYNIQNGAGLGRGFAGYAVAGYKSAVPGPLMDRKALMFASLYDDNVYILECSAHEDAFANWKGLFLSIAGSVNFRKGHHEILSGHYRNFMADPRIEFDGTEGRNTVSY